MSMTPAEMREMAAKVAQKRADGGLSGECERGHVEYDTGAFVCSNRSGCLCQEREEEAEAIAIEIRAIPIPDTTAADDALETTRWKLRKIGELSEIMMTGQVSYLNRIKELSSQALAAIDAAKAKGGG